MLLGMDEVITFISDKIVWSPLLVIFCLASGLFFSIATRFLQLSQLVNMIKLLFDRKKKGTGISSFQSFTMSLAGRIGIGNISGTATAVFFGGPGAVFWMWMIAFLGAATSFIECTLAQVWKEEVDGQYRGGPAYYISKGLGWRRYATFFAITCVLACGLLLPGVQSGTVITAINDVSGVNKSILGLMITIFLGIIMIGGIKRIAKVAEILVPFMAVGYLLVLLLVLIKEAVYIPEMFAMIFSSALGVDALFGGVLGSAVSWGVKRGAYANEAGMGNAPHAAAAAEVSHPAKQGLIQAFSVYVDTFMVCTGTAFVMLLTKCYNVVDERTGAMIVEYVPHLEKGAAFTQAAVEPLLAGGAGIFIAVALSLFAFTSLLSYYYQAETNLSFIFKDDKKLKQGIIFLQIIFLTTIFMSSLRSMDTIWAMGDIGVGLMAWLNMIAIFKLRKQALAVWHDYRYQQLEGVDPVFIAKKVGIKNADLWNEKNNLK